MDQKKIRKLLETTLTTLEQVVDKTAATQRWSLPPRLRDRAAANYNQIDRVLNELAEEEKA